MLNNFSNAPQCLHNALLNSHQPNTSAGTERQRHSTGCAYTAYSGEIVLNNFKKKTILLILSVLTQKHVLALNFSFFWTFFKLSAGSPLVTHHIQGRTWGTHQHGVTCIWTAMLVIPFLPHTVSDGWCDRMLMLALCHLKHVPSS